MYCDTQDGVGGTLNNDPLANQEPVYISLIKRNTFEY